MNPLGQQGMSPFGQQGASPFGDPYGQQGASTAAADPFRRSVRRFLSGWCAGDDGRLQRGRRPVRHVPSAGTVTTAGTNANTAADPFTTADNNSGSDNKTGDGKDGRTAKPATAELLPRRQRNHRHPASTPARSPVQTARLFRRPGYQQRRLLRK
jgi:hypothetical protein